MQKSTFILTLLFILSVAAPLPSNAQEGVVCAAVMPECDEETKRPKDVDPSSPCYWYYAHQCLTEAYNALKTWCDSCIQAGTTISEQCVKKQVAGKKKKGKKKQ